MMYWVDYINETRANALDAINENAEYYETWDEMEDALFIDDAVTGNGSGSYTFCTATAAENVSGILWEEDAIREFKAAGYEGIPTDKGPEAVDVIARCLALYYCDGLEDAYNNAREGAE